MDTLKTIGEWFVTGLVTIGLVAAPAAPAVPVDSSAERIAILEARLLQLEGAQYDSEEPVLGAEVPNVPALFDSFLAVGISPAATTMTLAHSTTRDGETLSGRYCFTLEINTPRAEYVCGNASGATVTGLERGIKVSNPNATSSALAFSHGRLATVSITDYPAWQIVKRQLTGQDALEGANPLRYDGLATTSFSHEDDLVSRKYVDDIAFGSVPAASETASGFVELATQVEAASSTSLGGTGARLVLPASIATSTVNSTSTSARRVVMTGPDGYVDIGFTNPIYRIPAGTVNAYASSTPPSGWLNADGSTVSRTTYAALYAAIGTTYGSGDGSTTFNLPDLRGRHPVSASSTQTTASGLNRSTYGATGTTTTHSLTEAQLAPHTHGINTGTGGAGSVQIVTAGTQQFTSIGRSTESTGSGTAFNILDPYIVMNYIIKY
jgi:microcystin-dependent protein